MVVIISELSKYLMIILFACYTYESFSVLARKKTLEVQKRIMNRQLFFVFLIHLNANAVIFANTQDLKLMFFYLLQVILIIAIQLIYRIFYKKASILVTNHLCMLLVISFVILTRLNEAKAVRQFSIAVAASFITLLVPFLIRHIHFLHRLPYLYAAVGILLLAMVAVMGQTSYGAKLTDHD